MNLTLPNGHTEKKVSIKFTLNWESIFCTAATLFLKKYTEQYKQKYCKRSGYPSEFTSAKHQDVNGMVIGDSVMQAFFANGSNAFHSKEVVDMMNEDDVKFIFGHIRTKFPKYFMDISIDDILKEKSPA